MMRYSRNDSVMSYVNRREARRAGASTCSKASTFWQMLLMTAGISTAMMFVFHSFIF